MGRVQRRASVLSPQNEKFVYGQSREFLLTVAKAEFHFGELFPRVGFIVTNVETDRRAVVRFYNKRGAAEQWIKEGKQAVKMTRLSCHRFRSNQVRRWLSVQTNCTWEGQ